MVCTLIYGDRNEPISALDYTQLLKKHVCTPIFLMYTQVSLFIFYHICDYTCQLFFF